MSRRIHTTGISSLMFALNMIGRNLGYYVNERFFAVAVPAVALSAFVWMYAVAESAINRLIVSVYVGYSLTSLIKELVFDPSRPYPFEYLSIIPVAYTVLKERKKLLTRQHQKQP